MNRKNISSFLTIFSVIFTFCCLGWVILSVFSLFDAVGFLGGSGCVSHLPPKDLKATDLVGTWVAGMSTQDTLILRQDNKYKQIIYSEKRNINYQTEWQDWRLEQDNSGYVWLHLKGMRMCGVDSLLSCEDLNYSGYDVCQNRSILMNGEGILSVKSYDEQVGSHEELILFFPLGSENTYVYVLQKP